MALLLAIAFIALLVLLLVAQRGGGRRLVAAVPAAGVVAKNRLKRQQLAACRGHRAIHFQKRIGGRRLIRFHS